jgi:hypothetical protein
MSWDRKRANGPKYYYRSVRQDGRVRKLYLGRGPAAESAARQDQEARAARIGAWAAARAARERVAGALDAARAFRIYVDLLTRASLLAAGLRFHRGEWRRPRAVKEDAMTMTVEEPKVAQPTTAPEPAPKADSPKTELRRQSARPKRTRPVRPKPAPTEPAAPPPEAVEPVPPAQPVSVGQAEAFKIIVARANSGNETCRRGLATILDDNPEIWQTAGDLGRLAENAWLDAAGDGDVLTAQAGRRFLDALKARVAGPAPTPLDELLVSQVAVTKLAAEVAEAQAAQPAGGSLAAATFRLKQAESAQKRHLTAIKTLTFVRALTGKGVFERSAVPSSPRPDLTE